MGLPLVTTAEDRGGPVGGWGLFCAPNLIFTTASYPDPAFGDPRVEPRHAALVWRGFCWVLVKITAKYGRARKAAI